MIIRAAVAALIIVAAATPAAGQTANSPRFFVNANVATQTGDYGAATTFTSEIFQETATVSVRREIKAGLVYDFAVGMLSLRGPIGVAGNVTTWKRSTDGTAEASIPHPIFFDQPRTVTGTVAGMKHEETWIAVLGTWRRALSPRLELMAMAGPAVAMTIHEVPTAADVAETSAGPDVRVTLVTEDKQLWGYHVGADVRYELTPLLGVGGFARVTGARGNIRDVARLELGGFSAGGGIRLRF